MFTIGLPLIVSQNEKRICGTALNYGIIFYGTIVYDIFCVFSNTEKLSINFLFLKQIAIRIICDTNI